MGAGEVAEIWPTTAAAQQALSTLDGPLRAALETYLARRELTRSLEFNSRRLAEWMSRPYVRPIGGVSTVRRERVPDWGEVYRITIADGPAN